MYNGRRQPSRDGTSRMTRECHVRFCEGLGVKFPGPTRHSLPMRSATISQHVWNSLKADAAEGRTVKRLRALTLSA
jgi:hypothetical protein